MLFLYVFFFFQAEDGIRDTSVTGVQTCALPIYLGYQVSLVVSGSSSRSDDRGSNPAPTTGGHLRSRVR